MLHTDLRANLSDVRHRWSIQDLLEAHLMLDAVDMQREEQERRRG